MGRLSLTIAPAPVHCRPPCQTTRTGSDVGDLLPIQFALLHRTAIGPRRRAQYHQPILEPHVTNLIGPNPAWVGRGVDTGDQLFTVEAMVATVTAVFAFPA